MYNHHKVYLIVAVDEKNGIGCDQKIPWKLSKEMQYFKNTTMSTEDISKLNMVIMGRTTWESIPEKYRPLKGRNNVVLTKQKDFQATDAEVFHSIEEALENADHNIENIFIIGGASVYKEAIDKTYIDGIYVTRIHKTYNCDTFFPNIPQEFDKEYLIGNDQEDGVSFDYYQILR